MATAVCAMAVVWRYRHQRRILEAYGVDIWEARRWKSLGLSPEQARHHQDLGPEFVESWLAAGFTVDEMDELVGRSPSYYGAGVFYSAREHPGPENGLLRGPCSWSTRERRRARTLRHSTVEARAVNTSIPPRARPPPLLSNGHSTG